MADTLNIFGTEYTGVTGIIATTPNETDLTYIRPQGNKSISSNGTNIDVTNYQTVSVSVPETTFVVTISWDNNEEMWVPDCTYAEVLAAANAGKTIVVQGDWYNTGLVVGSWIDTSTTDYLYYIVDKSFASQEGGPDEDYLDDSIKRIEYTFKDTGLRELTPWITIEPSGSLSITSNNTYDVTTYSQAVVNVPTGTTRSSSDLTVSGATVTVPAGLYSEQATKTIASGSATAPASINGTAASVSTGTNTLTLTKTVSVTPTVSAGYILSGTAGNSSVSLTANITVNPTPTASGATVTIPSGYYTTQTTKSVDTMTLPTSATSSATSGYTSKATIGRSTAAQYINIPPGYNSTGAYYVINAVANGSATAPASISGTSATITTGTNTITLTKTVSVTPTVSAGYVSSGTAGNSSVSLTASVTVNPTPTASGATVTIPAGYYSTQTTKSVTSGSATGPSSLSGTSATVSTGTNTLTLTKTGVTTTPTVSAGYVSSATASTATVTLTASVTTKAAATITPTTTNQTIASGTYLTGTQTIAGDADLVGSNIISTANIFGVQGTVVLQTVYTGSSAPSSSTGSNGDIYIQS